MGSIRLFDIGIKEGYRDAIFGHVEQQMFQYFSVVLGMIEANITLQVLMFL